MNKLPNCPIQKDVAKTNYVGCMVQRAVTCARSSSCIVSPTPPILLTLALSSSSSSSCCLRKADPYIMRSRRETKMLSITLGSTRTALIKI